MSVESKVRSHIAVSRTRDKAQLLREIKSKNAVIGVVGLGYVGLPLAVEYAEKGFTTIGFDISKEKVLQLNAGKNYIQDVRDEALLKVVEDKSFHAEDDFKRGSEVDVFFICVPTPVTTHKDPDVKYIRAAAEAIAEHLRAGQLIILKSTTYPDTTEGLVQPILEAKGKERGLQLGRDFFLAFSPERIDPGNTVYTTANTPVVVGGVTPACTELAALAMKQVVNHVHTVSSPKVAEMEKLLENIFRSVNIALVNELAQLCDRMGNVSIWEVVEAAATKPFGFMPFYPGPGLGGHCIPIDPYYLSWLARKYDFETNFITLSARTNEQMPYYVVDAIMRAVAHQAVKLPQAKLLLLGVAFKKNVDDMRHSPAMKIWELLLQKGFEQIDYADPFVPKLTAPDGMEKTTVELSDEAVRSYNVVIAVTDHDGVPYTMIAEHAQSIIDTRNAFKHIPHNREKVHLVGGGDF